MAKKSERGSTKNNFKKTVPAECLEEKEILD